MATLPRALAPWSEQLGIFPLDLAVVLGGMVRRLSLALGPMRTQFSPKIGEPDGYAGIARRGSYERLLISEWLLAEEAPDEFARRAAMGEHGFLQLAFRERSGALRCFALFDAGPNQLGSPRLAHLALLIVLARRAQQALADFSWAVLQQPKPVIHNAVTPHTVMDLVEARTAFPTSRETLELWKDTFNSKIHGDLWLIGGHDLIHRTADVPSKKLLVEDVLEPQARKLRISVIKTTHVSNIVDLELPETNACIRLLRDPFRITAPPSAHAGVRIDDSSELVFSAAGSKLFARMKSGGVVILPVPNSPRETVGGRRTFVPREGHKLVAVGWHKGKAIGIAVDKTNIYLYGYRGHAQEFTTIQFDKENAPFFQDSNTLTPVYWGGVAYLADPNQVYPLLHGFVFCDQRRTLFQVRPSPRPECSITHRNVIALTLYHSRTICLLSEEDKWKLVWLETGNRHRLPSAGYSQAFFGFSKQAFWNCGLLAVRREAGAWDVFYQRTFHTLHPFPGTSVVGVAQTSSTTLGLLLLDDSKRSLSLVGVGGNFELLKTGSKITSVVCSPAESTVAVNTVNGEVLIYSLDQQTVLVRFLSGQE